MCRKSLNLAEIKRVQKVLLTWRLSLPASNRRASLLASIILGTGIRVMEARRLQWANFYYDRPPRVKIIGGKGNKDRTVLIPPSLCEILVTYPIVGEYVFPSPFDSSKMISKRTLQRDIKRVFFTAKVDGYHSVHDLRHTYATHLYISSGRDVTLVQRQLGHMDSATTVGYIGGILEVIEQAIGMIYK